MHRTHTCGGISLKNIGKSVTLAGWVQNRRDHGGLIFVDLRDYYGLTQVVFDPKNDDAFKVGDQARSEFVLQVTGIVRERPADMRNSKLSTGTIEVLAEEAKVLSEAKTTPFEINKNRQKVAEDLRLEYRFLDLRNKELQEILQKRDTLIGYVREYFHKKDFLEVQTPIIANSSPEGARDYVIPSRLYPGMFYALPQAPQQFKQLLMVGGIDRYFQIAPCFRDEDPRMDRHAGTFYQIDLEMSFAEQEDIWNMVEPLMIELTEEFSNKKVLARPFPRITWKDAYDRYGSDKPDLRFDMEFIDVTADFNGCGFKVFADVAAKKGNSIKALKVTKPEFSRGQIDALTELAKNEGMGGLAYIVFEREPKSPIVKFMTEDELGIIKTKLHATEGDTVFFAAGPWMQTCKAFGAVRNKLGEMLGLKDNTKAAWAWVTDFPMYEKNTEAGGKIDFSHNPFSMPQGGMKALTDQNPLDILAYQYDLVLNGFEISSGAIRNHRPDIMYKAFAIAGYSQQDVMKKFGHMIKAFEFGAPPHGGIAPGIDRLLMVLWDMRSIRDIYAFPLSSSAKDLMLGSPSEISAQQLKDLHIKLDVPKSKKQQ